MSSDDAPDPRPTSEAAGPRGKVERVIASRGLQGLGETLERRWTAGGDQRQSLRDLADLFNRRVLDAALTDAGHDVLEGEVEAMYGLLTGAEGGTAARTKVRTRLRRLGVDVEALRADFVSHQAVHTYLTEHRGVSAPEDDDGRSRLEKRAAVVRRLRNRLVSVATESLEGLERSGDLELGAVEVMTTVSVYCEDCGTTRSLQEVLDAGGCDCDAGTG